MHHHYYHYDHLYYHYLCYCFVVTVIINIVLYFSLPLSLLSIISPSLLFRFPPSLSFLLSPSLSSSPCSFPETTCGKAWTFVRVIGHDLRVNGRILNNVPTRAECQAECLRASDIPCRCVKNKQTRKQNKYKTKNKTRFLRSHFINRPTYIFFYRGS